MQCDGTCVKQGAGQEITRILEITGDYYRLLRQLEITGDYWILLYNPDY